MVRAIIWLAVGLAVVVTFVYFHGKTEYRHPKHQKANSTSHYMAPPGDPRGGR